MGQREKQTQCCSHQRRVLGCEQPFRRKRSLAHVLTLALILLGVALLYLWLRGWWFAGLIVFLAYGIGGTQRWGHSWLAAIVIGFGPWMVWNYVRQMRRDRAARSQTPLTLALRSAPADERY
jgi:predicted nucleic acid-binding Zn ribbon protein